MYLTKFTATNIKCFEHIELNFPLNDTGTHGGWNVLLGTNATGKTTLLQAMAVGLIGATAGMRLISPGSWVRRNANYGTFETEFVKGDHDIAIGQPRKGTPYRASFVVTGNESIKLDGRDYTSPEIVLRGNDDDNTRSGLLKGPYAADKAGWLVCGYGSFRRFMGGSDHELTYDTGRVGRVASLFKESIALERSIKFLPLLYSRSQDQKLTKKGKKAAKDEYEWVSTIINQLLPSSVVFSHADTERSYFRAPGASSVELLDLSDGYRSFLSLVLELLRQISEAFGGIGSLVLKDGKSGLWCVLIESVVLIDEADLRLHPSWQREIGPRLRAVFPLTQFIVSSHSPFIAQEATPNGLFVLQASNDATGVQCVKPLPRVDGWTVDEILQSPLFGLTSTRSTETERLLKEHAELRGVEKSGKPSLAQRKRLGAIEHALAEQMTSPGEQQRRALDAKIHEAAAKARGSRNA